MRRRKNLRLARLTGDAARLAQRCFVVGCTRSDWSQNTMRHALPKYDALNRVWRERIGLADTADSSRALVCGRHFSPDDYVHDPRVLQAMNSLIKPRLKSGALPKLFVPNGPPKQPQALESHKVPVSRESCLSKVSQQVLPSNWSTWKATVGTQTEVVEQSVRVRCVACARTMTVKHYLPEKGVVSTQTTETAVKKGRPRTRVEGMQTASIRCTIGLQTLEWPMPNLFRKNAFTQAHVGASYTYHKPATKLTSAVASKCIGRSSRRAAQSRSYAKSLRRSKQAHDSLVPAEEIEDEST